MKVAITSPCKTTGTTTVTTLIAGLYGLTQEQDVIVTFTSSSSHRICDYTNTNLEDDITASATQMYNLIMADTINQEDCKDYMTYAGPHMYLMDTSLSILTLEERIELMRKIYNYNAAPLTVCDITTSLSLHKDDLAKEILDMSDLCCYVVNTDLKSVEGFKRWVDIGLINRDKPIMLIVNNFDERAYSIHKVASMFGVQSKNVFKIHRSPYIQKMSNEGKVHMLNQEIVDKEIPVFELNADFRDICKNIAAKAGFRFKWGS